MNNEYLERCRRIDFNNAFKSMNSERAMETMKLKYDDRENRIFIQWEGTYAEYYGDNELFNENRRISDEEILIGTNNKDLIIAYLFEKGVRDANNL